MKFSFYGVDSLLAKPLNKTRISTAHITAYIQPRKWIYKLTLSVPLQIHCCFPKHSSLWLLKLNWTFGFLLQFLGHLTSGGGWIVESCWTHLTNLTIFFCSQLAHKTSDLKKSVFFTTNHWIIHVIVISFATLWFIFCYSDCIVIDLLVLIYCHYSL